MGTTLQDIAYDDWQAEQAQLEDERRPAEEYEIYQTAFKVALSDSLVGAAQACDHRIRTEFFTALHAAKESIEEAARRVKDGGVGSFDMLLVSFVRGYRAIEWYHTQLSAAIAAALTEPFDEYVKQGAKIKAWQLFRPGPMAGLRNTVLKATFDPAPFVDAVADFYGRHDEIRHATMHGNHQPTLDEAKTCVTDAIAIYNLVDERLNTMHRLPLDGPDFSWF